MAQRRSSSPKKQMSFRVAAPRSFLGRWQRPMRTQGNSAGPLKWGNLPSRLQSGRARLPMRCNKTLPGTKLVCHTAKTSSSSGVPGVERARGKAASLYQRMRENGVRDLRRVIGRRAPTSRSTHAWVEWTTASATYVLDPTINWAAQRANEIADNSYVPYYVYIGSRRYRAAAATSLYARL